MERKNFPIVLVVLIWFMLAFLAVLNGAFRIYAIIPNTGEYTGHILSSFIFSAVIIFVAFVFVKKKKIKESKMQIRIGLTWLLMTITFEFLFGHFVMNNTWEKLFHDYNLMEGRVWILVLVVTFFSPLIAGIIVNRSQK